MYGIINPQAMLGTDGGRANFLQPDDYYMMLACTASFRSKDPDTQCGAVLVDPKTKKVFGMGWNGMPQGSTGLPFGHQSGVAAGAVSLNDKLTFVCHAEENALIFRERAEVDGATMYCTRYPCNVCAKYMVQSGIRRVVYLYEKLENGQRRPECVAATILFQSIPNRIEVTKFGRITKLGDNSIDSCEKLMRKVFEKQFCGQ